MLKILNLINNKWNQIIFWFHDFSVKTNIKWLISLSIWAYDKLIWNLPDKYQLIGDLRLSEYKLLRELELAHHQISYYANYANELQWQILEITEQKNTILEVEETSKRYFATLEKTI